MGFFLAMVSCGAQFPLSPLRTGQQCKILSITDANGLGNKPDQFIGLHGTASADNDKADVFLHPEGTRVEMKISTYKVTSGPRKGKVNINVNSISIAPDDAPVSLD